MDRFLKNAAFESEAFYKTAARAALIWEPMLKRENAVMLGMLRCCI